MTGLIISIAGVLAANIGVLLAQSTGTGAAGELGPYVSGGGALGAVGGLIWFGRQMAAGKLVSRDVADEAQQLKRLIEKSAERERRLERLEEAGADRERSYHSMLQARARRGGTP